MNPAIKIDSTHVARVVPEMLLLLFFLLWNALFDVLLPVFCIIYKIKKWPFNLTWIERGPFSFAINLESLEICSIQKKKKIPQSA